MGWCRKIMHPLRGLYFGVPTRFRIRIRKSGLLKLQRDIRACEYEDIQIMWEMLKRSESVFAESPVRSKKRKCWKMFKWARSPSCSYGST